MSLSLSPNGRTRAWLWAWAVLVVLLLLVLLAGYRDLARAGGRLQAAARTAALTAATGASNLDIQRVALTHLLGDRSPDEFPGYCWVKVEPLSESQRPVGELATVELWWSYPSRAPLFRTLVPARLLYARASEYLTTAHAATALPPADTLDPAVDQPAPLPTPPPADSAPSPTPLTVTPAPEPMPGE